MSRTRALAGGGRAVEIEPERLVGFLDRFADSHGGLAGTDDEGERVRVHAADGWVAAIEVPFGPPTRHGGRPVVDDLVAHLLVPRTVGLLLVRLGGYSVGVVRDGAVLTSSTGSRPVHGRSAAGGQSQQRFAR
ncbi:MAG: acVLRF1 family peptidyl-tRNA hydrolase, partial [Pseudonocardiaceae bacterium]